ncbi:MAG: polymerase sigma 70 [Mucilaginibacter sp.]|uniref:RNA polymerase sigma factor n=1 Tax=Mucilaginibacter sp. TaxID=1882438 RepID=UPI002617A163|nr:RNA polymerase sigma-70 factor [Mucilaginibacter sp.]MDB5004416.1 polymerase sigma 70 [Mucilaginibacter sp.]
MAALETLSDQELLDLVKQDQETAFEELYLRYDALLYSYAFRKLQDKLEAQDVVQEVFIALWNKRADFELKTTLQGYLYKLVLNRVLDIFKHRTIRTAYANRYVKVDSAETDFLLRENELIALIEKEIAAMPPKMREIYILKRKQYLSSKEIAEQLGISEHTVNTQMKRALHHLRVKLGILVYLLYIFH